MNDLGPELSSRKNPFPRLRPQFTDLIPFDVQNDATYCEFLTDSSLYSKICEYVSKLHSVQKSCLIEPLPSTSPSTKLLEKYAREAYLKAKKKSENKNSDEEKAQVCEEKQKEEEEESKNVKLLLGLGVHHFQYENEDLYLLHQTIGQPSSSGWNCAAPKFFKSLILFCKGQQRSQFLCDYCSHVIEWSESKKDILFFDIYRFDVQYQYWKKTVKKIARHPETIILPKKTWDTVMQDITRFLDEKTVKWYFEHGIPYKRNYLFYGVPGSGKTSLIQALAGKYNRNLCFLQPTHPKMTDDTFKACIQNAPANSLIVLEDIDALFTKDRSKKELNCPLTFSGLLNGLDGVGNPDGQLFILTTNFVEKLDKALIRSGRVDVHIEFPLATDEQLHGMFLLFYPECTNTILDEFVIEIRSNFTEGISMAAVQQLFIQNMFADESVIVAEVKNLGERLDVVKRLDEESKMTDEEEKEEPIFDISTLKAALPEEWKSNKACLALIEFAEEVIIKSAEEKKSKIEEKKQKKKKKQAEEDTNEESENGDSN